MTVYFDNAATTRVCPEAAKAAFEAMTENFGNPSSMHSLGRRARVLLDGSRIKVASALGCSPEEVYFTSGGTEADNWAVFGAAEAMRHRGGHIITSMAEHDAVRGPVGELARRGAEVTYLRPGRDGRISAEAFENALREDTVLVSVMLVNNETGAVNPVAEIAGIMKRRASGALLHTDAVQAFGKLNFTPSSLGADLVTVSSHKIHGPKGAGALYIKKGVKIPARSIGGGQEKALRGGTEALPNIAGFGEAARIAKETLSGTEEHLGKLRGYTIQRLEDKIPGIIVIGGGTPQILSLSLRGYRSEVLMNYLDAEGICVSRSSACKKGARSHVLEAMGLPSDVIDGAIRVSFSRESTFEEADYFAEKLCEASRRILKMR